jgi:hypothetical protein
MNSIQADHQVAKISMQRQPLLAGPICQQSGGK